MPRNLVDLPAPTGAGPDGSIPGEEPEEAVSPEEQAQYDQFVSRALNFIHNPESRDAIIDHLNDTQVSIPEAVGRTAAFIAQRMVEAAKAMEVQLSPDVVYHAGTEIVTELFLIGSRAGIFDIDFPDTQPGEEPELEPETQEMVEQAFAIAAHHYGKDFVQTEEGQALKEEAENFFAMQVAKEADAGQLNPEFVRQTEATQRRSPQVRQGVRRAIVPTEE